MTYPIVGLYSLWEDCHYKTITVLSRTEETRDKLATFQTELSTLKASLRKDRLQRRKGYSGGREGSSDSGIR